MLPTRLNAPDFRPLTPAHCTSRGSLQLGLKCVGNFEQESTGLNLFKSVVGRRRVGPKENCYISLNLGPAAGPVQAITTAL